VTPEQLVVPSRTRQASVFQLTNAVRPTVNATDRPREGYRRDVYRDPQGRLAVPALVASVSCEKLFDLFLDLLAPLGPIVDIVLRSAHAAGCRRDSARAGVDLPVLQSHLLDYEELLVHDGCTGVVVLSAAGPMEVQFDEHKLLIVYARDLTPFERIVRDWSVPRIDGLKLITESEHLHRSEARHWDEFRRLCRGVGVEG
jgi:hypothetical protein